jgi:hypothetical protein
VSFDEDDAGYFVISTFPFSKFKNLSEASKSPQSNARPICFADSRRLCTALHDAGYVREQIRAITGHTIASINEVLDRYTKLTADQAEAALAKRLAHEGQSAEGTVSTLVRR